MQLRWFTLVAFFVFAALVVALVTLSLPEHLPACESIGGNIDGTAGEPCGSGRAWTPQAYVGLGVAAVTGFAAMIGLARPCSVRARSDLRRRPAGEAPRRRAAS